MVKFKIKFRVMVWVWVRFRFGLLFTVRVSDRVMVRVRHIC